MIKMLICTSAKSVTVRLREMVNTELFIISILFNSILIESV